MSITLRDIREDDLEMIMHWRMDPDITRYMNTDPELTLADQKKWLEFVRHNNCVMYWIVGIDEIPVGLINLTGIDWEKKESSWGYYIAKKNFRSLNLAISLEMSLYDYVFDVLELETLNNEVFSLNAGVIKLHLACGSHITKEIKGEVEKAGVAYDITHISITKDEWYQIRWRKKYERVNFDIKMALHHIGYAVADIEKSLAKYIKIGYYQVSKVFDDTVRNVRIVFIENRQDCHRIELIAPLNEKSPVSDTLKYKKNVSTPYHVCYEVESLERSIEILKKRGFMLITKPSSAIAFNDRHVVFLVNKEVGLIELVEK